MWLKTTVWMCVGTLVMVAAVQSKQISAAIQQGAPDGKVAAQGAKAWEPVCKPLSQRTGELGCWITAHTDLGPLPQEPIFWHLDTYPTRAAAEAAKGPRGTVVESLGKVWLLTIDVAGWGPSRGKRVAKVGPLPVSANTKYSAQYMEAIFTPGMTAPAHKHSGPEAWYTLS